MWVALLFYKALLMTITRSGGGVSPEKIQDTSKNTIVLANSSTNSIDFSTNGNLKATLDSNGNLIFGTYSGSSGIEFNGTSTSTDFGLRLSNVGSGDVKTTFHSLTQSYSVGIDNSDSDSLKISTSPTDVGTQTLPLESIVTIV